MKKFSKMLVLGMALSLAFGVTAFAADSPTVGNTDIGEVTLSAEGLEGGQELVVKQESDEQLRIDNDLCAEILQEAGYVGAADDAYIQPIAVFEVELSEGTVGDGGITITFNGAFDSDLKYVVLHYNGTKWEALTTVVSPDGSWIKATFTSLSPVAIVEVGEAEDDNNTTDTPSGNGNTGNNSSQSSSKSEAPKSPQTGETLPIAGFMALICLAGAAICAGKVRYNKQ